MPNGDRLTRKTQLAKREAVRKQLHRIFNAVEDGYTKQVDRADNSIDYWDIYNCKLSGKQFYAGNSRIFVPLVFGGIEARKTRFLNTLFPATGRYVEVTSEDGEIPHAVMALLEGYVERAKLATDVVPPMLVAGDIEGQYTLCVGWGSVTRHVVERRSAPLTVGGIEHPGMEVETIEEETIEDAGPTADLIPDSDLLILPATAETVEQAIEMGGSVTTVCRWTQERVEELIDSDEIDGSLSAEFLVEMSAARSGSPDSIAKKLAGAAGIKAGGKFAEIFRTWARIKIGKERRLVLAYYAGDGHILGCKLCPYWCDKPDIISRPVRKMPGVAKGMSIVSRCADMQYAANDAVNEGLDSATYSMLPVIMTDPEKNPRVGSMVMDLMAVWETSPRDTQPLQFPQLYQHAFNIAQACEQKIMATLGVNAAMLPQSTGVPGRKRNQAEIALEQQIDLLSASVEVRAAEGVLSEVVQRWAEYDAQFRDDEATVMSRGELGVEAMTERVPPIQMGKRWRFRWFGAEAARTAQQIQQQIAFLNVMNQMAQSPAVAQAGYRVNPIPFIRTAAENAFGPRLAPEVFENLSDRLVIDPEIENEMLMQTLAVDVSPMDNDAKHIQAHLPLAQAPDMAVQSVAQTHIAAHQRQMQMKQAAMMMQKMQQAMQQGGGAPGAGGGRQGPRPGGQPQMPRPMRGPAGTLHPDQMPKAGGVVSLPRKTG